MPERLTGMMGIGVTLWSVRNYEKLEMLNICSKANGQLHIATIVIIDQLQNATVVMGNNLSESVAMPPTKNTIRT